MVLTESMTNSFQKLGENLNVMNVYIMSLVQWPEDELSEDISEQLDVQITKLMKPLRSILTMSKTLTSQLQAKQSKQSLQVKGKKLTSQLQAKRSKQSLQ